MSKKARVAEAAKRVAVEVPKNREEAAEFVRRVGESQRAVRAITYKAEQEVAEIQGRVTKGNAPYLSEIQQLVDGLFAFFGANKAELTDGGKRKTVELGTGTIGTHTNPHNVELTATVKEVLAALHGLNLIQFIRTVEEVNKEEMLKSEENRNLATSVKGVKIAQVTEFKVYPKEAVEIVVDEAKLLKRLVKSQTV